MPVARSALPVLLLALGVAGLAGLWPSLPAALLAVALLWLPGAVVSRRLAGDGDVFAGPGRFAFEVAISLAVATAAMAPLYVCGAPLRAAAMVLGTAFVMLAALEMLRPAPPVREHRPGDAAEWAALAAAVALLLPAVLRYSGGNVDDWWDLAFVRSWITHGRFSFEEPFLASGQWHPRFLWSVWLALQAVIGSGRADDLWRVQAGPLAAVVCIGVVSAFAALARALLGRGDPRTIAGIALVPMWLWGTEEIPFFGRVYQDKLVAAFVLAPVLLAAVVHALRAQATPSRPSPWRNVAAVALVAVATVSVHSLVYTMAVFAALLVLVAARGRTMLAWSRTGQSRALLAALALPALYPVGQALWLAIAFGAQGISLASVDNPVVRAHLALGRILGAGAGWDGRMLDSVANVSLFWIVHPGAVFGPIAALAAAGLVVLWRQRGTIEARILLVLTVVPLLLLFTPGLAALAGALWVPWMLYRIGWFVPVPLLIGVAVGEGLRRSTGSSTLARFPRLARAASQAIFVAALAAAWSEGADRVRRDMAEHPGVAARSPRGNSLAVYRFLATQRDGNGVLAPPGFAELVPAMTGHPVVAFTERGTLVFALDERSAYRRLRDRAEFFSSSATQATRDTIAGRYGARWAVLPRRMLASESEEFWIRRFGAESLAATLADDDKGVSWSSDRQDVTGALGTNWSIVLENRDWFVARRAAGTPAAREEGDAVAAGAETAAGAPATRAEDDAVAAGAETAGGPAPPWLSILRAQPRAATASASERGDQRGDPRDDQRDDQRDAHGGVLATVSSSPGALVGFEPPPQLLAPVAQPIWTSGVEPWEDVASEASVAIDIGMPCIVRAVRAIPYAPRPRREAFEIVVEDRSIRAQAVHDEPIDLPIDASVPRSRVTVQVRSLLGNPVSLRDVQLLGDPSTCEGAWPLYAKPSLDILELDDGVLQRLALEHPASGRPFLSLAHRASRAGRKAAERALLVEAARREPSLVQAWIDLGFHDEAAGDEASAIDAFDRAIRADSHSAWAHGCQAWANFRVGRNGRALWHALRARSLDPYYADGWTLLAYVAHRAGLDGVAERWLENAERVDPERNWPRLARAEFAASAGDVARARRILVDHLASAPFDLEARAKLRELDQRERNGTAVQ